MRAALERGRLTSGEASKLAGRLTWASQSCFRRMGRAMLSPIYKQQKGRSSNISLELRLALHWWLEVLHCQLSELRMWKEVQLPAGQLLCDARSTPPRVAAVLILDKKAFYSDWEPPAELVDQFKQRNDGQITSLEILSIAFALSTFENKVRGRNLVVYSDNTGVNAPLAMGIGPRVQLAGAEHTVRRGRAKEFDHTCLIHAIWQVLVGFVCCAL